MAAKDFVTAERGMAGLRKDLELITRAARDAGARTPMLSAVTGVFESAATAGLCDLDVSALVAVFTPP